MKDAGEVMEILEAFDLTGSYRTAAELAGCDHHTVKQYVEHIGQPAGWPANSLNRAFSGNGAPGTIRSSSLFAQPKHVPSGTPPKITPT